MANQTPQFADILDRAPTEVERPKPLPQGSYVTVIQGQPRYDKSSKKQTPYVEFIHKFVSALDDVDEEALKEALTNESGEVKPLSDVTMRNPYYLTENSAYRLDEFHEHCGIDLSEEKSRRERNEETPGRSVGLFIIHEASQDGTTTFARIGKTFVVE